ncbi:MAG: DNA polymerase Y family protein [Rhodobacteraceae bacterium]|nr:DNA polymerase Y family protein [Paracoccaceae bacterium]
MRPRRILSLWFPRLGAERALRASREPLKRPFAVTDTVGNMQILVSLAPGAEAAGLRAGQPLREARAICPDLLTHPRDAKAEAAMLAALCRWAGRFSPWIAEEPPDGLLVDLTGCAHLFGGEAALMAQIDVECAGFGLSVCAGLADTVGGAWALARFAERDAATARSGDAIDQEARATRSRAARRPLWSLGNSTVQADTAPVDGMGRIALPGRTRAALDPLPVAALRLEPEAVAGLTRLGWRRIGDLAGQPRAALARRFGRELVRRLDQAFGLEPEPVSPTGPTPRFALRLSLPDPIGLEEDLMAAIDRLLPEFAAQLAKAGRGARQVRLEALRCDGQAAVIEVGLARPGAEPDRIRPLLALKLGGIDAGPGIDALRLSAPRTEPFRTRQHEGRVDAADDVSAGPAAGTALDDLLARLGTRIGLEALTRLHPADSHIPEKTATVMAAAWSVPAGSWPPPSSARPALIWTPEPVTAPDGAALTGSDPPARFRWRRRAHRCRAATGPERIAPEWWLDDPRWRSGVRDYWQVTTEERERLWLYYAHGGQASAGWYCQGVFD